MTFIPTEMHPTRQEPLVTETKESRRAYANHFGSAGLPGHNLMLLVASLSSHLDAAHRLLHGLPPDDNAEHEELSILPIQPASTTPPRVLGNLATAKQIKAIYAIARAARGWDAEHLEEECRRQFNVVPQDLTRYEASSFIDALKQNPIPRNPEFACNPSPGADLDFER